MQFVTVDELYSHSADEWPRLAAGGELVVTAQGKPIAILSPVSADNFEASLAAIRRARAMTAVDAMQRRAVDAGADRITEEEIQQEIEQVRRGRKQ